MSWLERVIHWLEKNEHPRKEKKMAATVQDGFESSVAAQPRNGQQITVLGFTGNENTGVVVSLVPCPECSAAVEEGAGADKHASWHASQGGATPKSR